MSNKTNLFLDLIIFFVFLVVASPKFTGNTIHEWLSLSFFAAVITHLVFHWNWVIQVVGSFFKKLFHQSRLNFVVDLLFLIFMVGSIFSGILISKSVLPMMGIQLSLGQSWKIIHKFTSDASVILLGLHFGLHLKWIMYNIKQVMINPVISLFRNTKPQTLAVQTIKVDEDK